MIKKYILGIYLFAIYSVSATTPTLESMLRHGSNVDLNGRLINAKFIVEKISAGDIELGQNSSRVFVPFAYQWTGFKSGSKNNLMYLRYQAKNFESAELSNMSSGRIDKLKNKFFQNIPAGLFYSFSMSLLMNDGSVFIEFLKSQGIEVKLNKDLINREKLKLLTDYKKYQAMKKEDESTLMQDPFKSTDPEEQKRINELLKTSFYNTSENFKLVKMGNDFRWIFEKDNIYIEFNFDHQLRKLQLKTADGVYSIFLENYKQYPGGAIYPAYGILKLPDGTSYKLITSGISVYKSSIDSFNRKLKYFREKFNPSKKDIPSVEFLTI